MSSSRRERDDTLPAKLGEVIGGYRLESLIGEGGMGCVYAASHHRLGRPAAVKVLRTAYAADVDYVQRFFDEARVVNAIRHPNIIDIFDFVELENPLRVACIMELLEGHTLRTTLKAQVLELREAINLGIQLADALSVVHRLNVVHRDLKPDNIFVLQDPGDFSRVPSIKVLDFGIAKVQAPTGERTTPGMVLGTPGYMAPEQVSGQGVTPAADVYAFGTLLYEMLSGQRLFVGDSMAILRQKIVGDLPPFELPQGKIYRPLEDLIRRTITLQPKERPSIELVRRELESLRTGAEGIPLSRAPTVSLETQSMIVAPFDDPAPAFSASPQRPRPSAAAAPAASDDTVASRSAGPEAIDPPSRSWWPLAVLFMSLAVLLVVGTYLWNHASSEAVVVEPVRTTPAPEVSKPPAPEPTLAAPEPPPEPAAPTPATEPEASRAEPEPAAPEPPAPISKPVQRRPPREASPPAAEKPKPKLKKPPATFEVEKKPKPLRKDDMTPW